MVVPDFELICEIMLVAEGFQEARLLARKFITLYTLCKELLSKQDHYDWGLRAIKSVLVVAGSLKVSSEIMAAFCPFPIRLPKFKIELMLAEIVLLNFVFREEIDNGLKTKYS